MATTALPQPAAPYAIVPIANQRQFGLDEGASSSAVVVQLVPCGQAADDRSAIYALVKRLDENKGDAPFLFRRERAALKAALATPALATLVPPLLHADWPTLTLTVAYVPYPSLARFRAWAHAEGQVTDVGSLFRSLMLQLGARLLEAVALLATHGLAHGDIKPENVLYQPETGDFRLIDFGFALSASVSQGGGGGDLVRRGHALASPLYAAPEVLGRTESLLADYHVPTADCWSVGMTVFDALCNRQPFEPPVSSISALRRAVWKPLDLAGHARGLAHHEAACLQVVLVIDPKARADPHALAQRWWALLEQQAKKNTEVEATTGDVNSTRTSPPSPSSSLVM